MYYSTYSFFYFFFFVLFNLFYNLFVVIKRREFIMYRTCQPFSRTMEGGAETGFRHVEPTQYITRLLQVFGKGANLAIREVNVTYSLPVLWSIGTPWTQLLHNLSQSI